MNIKAYTAALITLGIISTASAYTEVHITGSTAFRSNFFTAATAASGGIFDAPGGVAQNGATSSSGAVTFLGNIGGAPYALECSWTGSEAGIANVDGVGTLANPGLPNSFFGSAGLPGATTTFPTTTGATTGGFSGAADLTLADTSQAVSLTKAPAHATLHDYGIVAVVTFCWEKGANSTPTSGDAGDTAWAHLTNVTHPEMLVALGSTVNANFLTGNAADVGTPVAMFGRNAGSGTRVNTLLDTFFGVGNGVTQFALNSTYTTAGVLTYNVIKSADTVASDLAAAEAATYPSVATSEGNTTSATTTPNFLGISNDGYDSGAGVSDCLSCDSSGSEAITLGYVGLSDAKHARDGQAASGTTPAQPSGAVILTLDGVTENDANIVNGTYTFWGHEHLLAASSPSVNAAAVEGKIITGLQNSGLGTGLASAQSTGILYSDMAADKGTFPNGVDNGYPTPF